MTDLEDRRGTFRIGVIMVAAALAMTTLALLPPFDGAALLWLIPVGLFGVTGLGLMRYARVARVVAALLLLACAVLAPVSAVRAIAASAPLAEASPAWLLSVANAAATTLLITWLAIRGIQTLFGRAPRASLVTARIVGGVLAMVAANHLWLATQVGGGWHGSWSIRISTDGSSLFGFPGWPIWHAAALGVGLILLVGPRRSVATASTALLALISLLVPLVAVATLGTHVGGLEIILLAVLLLPLYLAWWLRDELRVQ